MIACNDCGKPVDPDSDDCIVASNVHPIPDGHPRSYYHRRCFRGEPPSSSLIYAYRDRIYPEYLKTGNACQFIAPAALHFCQGAGLDVGAGRWPLPGAIPVDLAEGGDAMQLPGGLYDFVFSSHCLEHLANPVAALEHWKTRIRPGGVLFLYLPHPYMEYWLPQNNRKHLHAWLPADMAALVRDLGFDPVLHSERDLAWSFAVVGFNG